MEARGFIQSMKDVKILILYVMAQSEYPLTLQQIYELCFQDDRLSYFDVRIAIPEMVQTGHLLEVEHGKYQLTKMGREAEEATKDDVAAAVGERALAATIKFNQKMRSAGFVHSEICPAERGEYTVVLDLKDDIGPLMHLELMASSEQQARAMQAAYEAHAARFYRDMTQLLTEKQNHAKL